MRANPPRTSVFKGALSWSGDGDVLFTVPVTMYKKTEPLQLVESHKHHNKCLSRVEFHGFCPTCNISLDSGDIIKMAAIGESTVVVDSDTLSQVQNDGQEQIEILHPIPVADISRMLSEGMQFGDVYEVRGMKQIVSGRKRSVVPGAESALRLLFDALQRNKQALYVRAPLSGKRRYGILLASGSLLMVRYEEEIRADLEWSVAEGEGYNAASLKTMQSFLKTKQKLVAEIPSVSDIQDRVNGLLSAASSGETDTPGVIQPVGLIMSRLEEKLAQSVAEANKKRKKVGAK